MTFMEKINLAALVGHILVYGAYFAWISGDVVAAFGGEEVATASMPIFLAVIAFVVLMIIASILITIANPKSAEQIDERDKMIEMRGDRVASNVLAVFALGAMALALLNLPGFLIANAIFAGLVGGEILKGVARALDYRRGVA